MRSAKRIDRLIVVAHDDERPVRAAAFGARELQQQLKLRHVGVLELVDEDVTPPRAVHAADVVVPVEHADAVRQQVLEVKRVA